MVTFTNSEDLDEMPHNAAFHRGLHSLLSDNTIFKKIKPDNPRYVQWVIPSLLYQTSRKDPLVYKGLKGHLDLLLI